MTERSKKTQTPAAATPAPFDGVPVVALGTSAGGLKALETFFRNVPPESGMAFVVAMHLSPTHDSQLAQILQAFTAMPVTQVSTAVEVLSDHVYVISPRQHLALQGSHLQVSPRSLSPATGVIDHLFQSLAEDRHDRAVGIVFSGSGADGTIGLQAIKERGGLLLAQDPDEAEFAAMPRSIIATGLVDFVLPAAEMPAQLIALRDRAPRLVLPAEQKAWPKDDANALRSILGKLRAKTGYDFAHYKRTALLRQLGRRMLVLHDDSLPVYANRLQEDDGEVKNLFRNLLIGVTRFFRDPEAFDELQREALPKLFPGATAESGEPTPVRAWVTGCATGEEPYSLAMLLTERREATGSKVPIQILATDIDEPALSIARRGLYLETVAAGLTPARLQRFFLRREGAYQVSDELRDMVVFATHDLTRDPPFARIDLLSCRNLLMYFEADMQQQVLERCAYSLKPGGYLLLGAAEGIGRITQLFTPVSKKYGLYQRTMTARSISSRHFFPVVRVLPEAKEPSSSHSERHVGAEENGGGATATDRTGTPARNEIGELEQSNDALILANQEMQSLNEELRSMMEEIEVAKEEMLSLNEELTTVNQELQNKIEEHRRVNRDLHVLIESTRMATLFLDHHFNVLLYTPESTKLFNLLPIDIGRPLEHLSHRLTYSGFLQDARQVLERRATVEREVQTQNGNWYFMRVMPYQMSAAQSWGVVLTFADITSQKEMEHMSENRFALAFHAGPMAASIVTRDDTLFLDVNEIFEQITGYTQQELVGQPALDFGLRIKGEDERGEVARGGDERGGDERGGDERDEDAQGENETQIRTKSGAIHGMIVSTTPIEFRGQPCYLSLYYDVTERKRLEREILDVSDREQRRIGVDLHDGLGTHLTGIALMARGIARDLRAGRVTNPEEIDEIARLLGDGVEQARGLAQGLNPFLLEVRGLTIALQELASNLKTQTGINCSFMEEGSMMTISSERSIHLYRIAQEALTNAVRHAQATRIWVTLSRRGHHNRLTIQDDGRGIDTAREPTAGMGLHLMRYRAEMIGARLDVSSSPNGGTTITCTFRANT